MSFDLTPRDLDKMAGVHPDLVRVIKRAAYNAPFRFRVTEGVRTLDRQKALVAKGASKTLNSRHLTGHAVDLVPYFDSDQDGDIDGDDMFAWPLYYKLAPVVKEAARDEGVAVEWGGDWVSFKDGPHWQLARTPYPARADAAPQSVRGVILHEPIAESRTEKTDKLIKVAVTVLIAALSALLTALQK